MYAYIVQFPHQLIPLPSSKNGIGISAFQAWNNNFWRCQLPLPTHLILPFWAQRKTLRQFLLMGCQRFHPQAAAMLRSLTEYLINVIRPMTPWTGNAPWRDNTCQGEWPMAGHPWARIVAVEYWTIDFGLKPIWGGGNVFFLLMRSCYAWDGVL